MGKKGVLLVNLGTPDEPTRGAVYRYLKEFLLDPRVIDIPAVQRNLLVRGIIAPFRSKPASKLYQELWTEKGSPLKVYGYRLKEMLQDEMGEEYLVDLAMRYQNPSIESVILSMLKQHVSELIIVPLFPHYASASTGSVYEEVMRVLAKVQGIPKLRFVNSFYDHPDFIASIVERAKEHDINDYDHVLFSYHGLPVRQLVKADLSNHCTKAEDCCLTISDKNQHCYSAQCHATTKALVKELGLKKGQYTTCFQSRLGKEPWVEPYTTDVLQQRADAGNKRLLVFCPAFVADCLETTIEVSVEYMEEFEEMGGEHVQLVDSLNDDPRWVVGLKNIILEA
ncbi:MULTISPECIES: ferrochelatase [unclassified Aureispira]|uniref:ferrochelatase n=1 Tax=unclassified Aureispira TaxID=2649989 RepID=UPI00069670D8|nr:MULTISPECIES: ferrochelatase [unclassified Aureispira]WMX14081.1 ferrochelatase [Aureispira sp. CCB-E]